MNYHLVARTHSCRGDFRAALQSEKEAFTIYKRTVRVWSLAVCHLCLALFIFLMCVCVCLVKLSHVGFLTIWVLTQRHVFWKEERGGGVCMIGPKWAWFLKYLHSDSVCAMCIQLSQRHHHLFVLCFKLEEGHDHTKESSDSDGVCAVFSWGRGTTAPRRAQSVSSTWLSRQWCCRKRWTRSTRETRASVSHPSR